jgi:hypothetical protein
MMRLDPVEVGLVLFGAVRILPAALNGHGASGLLLRRLGGPSTHLCPLLLEDCLARQADAVALYGEHLHQHLVAFL